jgi:hypothetical protein
MPLLIIALSDLYVGPLLPSTLPTLHMAAAVYAKAMEQLQHMTWLNPETKLFIKYSLKNPKDSNMKILMYHSFVFE